MENQKNAATKQKKAQLPVMDYQMVPGKHKLISKSIP
ncbi:unnamed protein product [Larinioides sclopetarius]|uniref:Uncharacterized protein n=1 Tax=Larinioides sclopetarius TaxID=280406 RepID=A0AAV1ZD55_9ARAC